METSLEEQVITMLTPKIKSLLRQTTQQNQEDLEQELILMVLTTINKKKFLNIPSFFDLLDAEK